jgi:hypothetical protein
MVTAGVSGAAVSVHLGRKNPKKQTVQKESNPQTPKPLKLTLNPYILSPKGCIEPKIQELFLDYSGVLFLD